MNLHIYRDVEQERTVFADYISYWSNANGDLHYHGQRDITEDELPAPLKRAYQELFFENETGSLRYLVETSKGFGISLIHEYDTYSAELFGLSMADLFEAAVKDAQVIAADPVFEKADITAAEGMGFGECHDLIVTFPADISKEEFFAAAEKLDQLVYQAAQTMDQKQKDAYKLCDQLQDLKENPLYWIAFDMAYLTENCLLDNPLSREEIYTLAAKLEEASGTLTAGLLHEEHLDAICYMMERGLHEDHSPEFPAISAEDARKLLLSADSQVFGALVETVALNNEAHDVAMEFSIDEEDLAAVLNAIENLGKDVEPEMAPGDKQMQSFFYTFGTSSTFPYKKGWVEVQAEDRPQADELFRSRFPDVHKGVLNCSFVYTKDQFIGILEREYEKLPNWKICHELISTNPNAKPSIEIPDTAPVQKKPPLADKILDAQNRNIESSAHGHGMEVERD